MKQYGYTKCSWYDILLNILVCRSSRVGYQWRRRAIRNDFSNSKNSKSTFCEIIMEFLLPVVQPFKPQTCAIEAPEGQWQTFWGPWRGFYCRRGQRPRLRALPPSSRSRGRLTRISASQTGRRPAYSDELRAARNPFKRWGENKANLIILS